MAKFEDVFKDELNKIDFAQDEKDNIRNQVIRKYKRKKRRDYSILCIVVLAFVCLFGFGIVYAEEIENFIEDLTVSTKRLENGSSATTVEMREVRKSMNYDADLPETTGYGPLKEYDIDELEKLLGFKILKSHLFEIKRVFQTGTSKEGGKIATASFNIISSAKRSENLRGSYTLHLSFSTKYDKEYNNVGYTMFSKDGVPCTEYFIKSLGVRAHIFNDNDTSYSAIFIYDDVVYIFHFYMYAEQNNDKTIREVLETFSFE